MTQTSSPEPAATDTAAPEPADRLGEIAAHPPTWPEDDSTAPEPGSAGINQSVAWGLLSRAPGMPGIH